MSEQPITINPSLCPLCGKANFCALEIEKTTGVKQASCWCAGANFSADLLARVPLAAQGQACICAVCAKSEPSAKNPY